MTPAAGDPRDEVADMGRYCVDGCGCRDAAGLDVRAIAYGHVGLRGGLCGRDVDVSQHVDFPASRVDPGPPKTPTNVGAAVVLAGFRRTVSRRFSVEKCCETSRLLDVSGRFQREQTVQKRTRKKALSD